MRAYLACTRVVLTIAIALMFVSSSEAGLFRRSRIAGRTSYQIVSAAPTQSVTSATVTSPQTASPTIISVSNEVVVPASGGATSGAATSGDAPPAMYPSGGNAGGWSVLPRSFSDYGKFPPYNH
jgi:hypothetical protein